MIRVKDNLNLWFKESKLTQREYAKRLGLNYAKLNLFLNKKDRPSMNELESMCKSLGCNVEDIIEFVKEETK